VGLEKDRTNLNHQWELLARAGSRFGESQRRSLDETSIRLLHAGDTIIGSHEASLALAASRLNDLSPLAVLARGYSIAQDADGHVISHTSQVESGDRINISVSDGPIACTVN
jgi:exodeoxyribonuclease VII large subunit